MLLLAGETKVRDLAVAVKNEKNDFLNIPLLSVKDIYCCDLDTYKVEIGTSRPRRARIERLKVCKWTDQSASLMPVLQLRSLQTKDEPQRRLPLGRGSQILVIDGYTVNFSDRSTANPYGIKVLSGKLDVAINIAYSQYKAVPLCWF